MPTWHIPSCVPLQIVISSLDNSTLNLYTPSNIAYEVDVDIQSGSKINLQSGELFLDNQDIWGGSISNESGTLTLNNVKVSTYRPDKREDFVFVDVKNKIIK